MATSPFLGSATARRSWLDCTHRRRAAGFARSSRHRVRRAGRGRTEGPLPTRTAHTVVRLARRPCGQPRAVRMTRQARGHEMTISTEPSPRRSHNGRAPESESDRPGRADLERSRLMQSQRDDHRGIASTLLFRAGERSGEPCNRQAGASGRCSPVHRDAASAAPAPSGPAKHRPPPCPRRSAERWGPARHHPSALHAPDYRRLEPRLVHLADRVQ
jgi:hypothetical protein